MNRYIGHDTITEPQKYDPLKVWKYKDVEQKIKAICGHIVQLFSNFYVDFSKYVPHV